MVAKDLGMEAVETLARNHRLLDLLLLVGYAVITYCQWKDIRHNFASEQRAWLKMNLESPQAITENPRFGISVTNIGKSPATIRRLNVDAFVQMLESTEGPSFGPFPHLYSDLSIIFPSDTTEKIGITLHNADRSERILTEREHQAIKDGKAYIVVFGRIVYRDQFGKHWTQFCKWGSYPNPDGFSARKCIEFNSVGDGDPPPH